jgi:RNA polymerase sigma factor (TIGR02999 family)
LASQASEGPSAFESAFARIYDRLRRVARWKLRREAPGQTLQPTALVHEVFVRMRRGATEFGAGATRIYNAANRQMRFVLVDRIRNRRRLKRGGPERERVPLPQAEEELIPTSPSATLLNDRVAMRDALLKMSGLPRKGERYRRIVGLHFYGGHSFKEIARMLDLTPRQVRDDWRFARTWLQRELSRGGR